MQVKASHWLRANHWGTIREIYDKHDHHPLKVEFDLPGPGLADNALWLGIADINQDALKVNSKRKE